MDVHQSLRPKMDKHLEHPLSNTRPIPTCVFNPRPQSLLDRAVSSNSRAALPAAVLPPRSQERRGRRSSSIPATRLEDPSGAGRGWSMCEKTKWGQWGRVEKSLKAIELFLRKLASCLMLWDAFVTPLLGHFIAAAVLGSLQVKPTELQVPYTSNPIPRR